MEAPAPSSAAAANGLVQRRKGLGQGGSIRGASQAPPSAPHDGANVHRKRRGLLWSGDEAKGLVCMALLAAQYALQPVVSKRFIRPAVIKTTIVLVCELCKIGGALLILLLRGGLGAAFSGWSVSNAFLASALPASIYAVQNVLVQSAYPHLDSLTLTMLNQTKLLFTALFTALLLGQRQSGPQVVALLAMLVAAVLLSWDPATSAPPPKDAPAPPASPDRFLLGVLPMLGASVLSGLASVVCQRALQVRRRDAFVMTLEMSVFGIAGLALTLPTSQDGHRMRALGFFHAWQPATLLPVLLYAGGGILVGLVTKYVGGLKKGFAIVVALLFTAILQLLIDQERPSGAVVVAMPLVTGGVLLHSMFPYKQSSKQP